MSFRYFACTDKMCIPVKQEYLIHWEADPDGGVPTELQGRCLTSSFGEGSEEA